MSVVEAKQAGSPSDYRSTRALTIAVLILVGAQIVLKLGEVLAIQYLRSLPPTTDVAETRHQIVGLLRVADRLIQLSFLSAAVCFLIWLKRAWANLPSLGGETTRDPQAPGIVVGWFIPLYNLVHGYRTVHQLYLESQRPAVMPDGYVLPTRAGIVGWWWGLWIFRNVVLQATAAMLRLDPGESIGLFQVATLVDVTAAMLFMLVVHRVDKRQRDQHDDQVRRQSVPGPSADLLR
jgi:hypothetical protein